MNTSILRVNASISRAPVVCSSQGHLITLSCSKVPHVIPERLLLTTDASSSSGCFFCGILNEQLSKFAEKNTMMGGGDAQRRQGKGLL